ncbi:MAG TPA: hypothetical protein VH120_18180, partial [Gemmataceae bacterium]|nr:hypothetical protein [Gemmataceae bacterium]
PLPILPFALIREQPTALDRGHKKGNRNNRERAIVPEGVGSLGTNASSEIGRLTGVEIHFGKDDRLRLGQLGQQNGPDN